jgi:hypothetical protein
MSCPDLLSVRFQGMDIQKKEGVAIGKFINDVKALKVIEFMYCAIKSLGMKEIADGLV